MGLWHELAEALAEQDRIANLPPWANGGMDDDTRRIPRKPRGFDDLMRGVNRYRWWRLKRDFRWAQRHARRFHMNPDDVRWWI